MIDFPTNEHGEIEWRTDKLFPACRCHVNDKVLEAGDIEVGESGLVKCQTCDKYENLYRTSETEAFIGLTGAMKYVEDNYGVIHTPRPGNEDDHLE